MKRSLLALAGAVALCVALPAAAGATAVFENNPFERRFRDLHAVSQQAQAQFAIYEVIGRHFLGLPLQSTRII